MLEKQEMCIKNFYNIYIPLYQENIYLKKKSLVSNNFETFKNISFRSVATYLFSCKTVLELIQPKTWAAFNY